uniref:Uncharacterized protein n=1 Tax=Oryza meridionalis TaxID=40149 RepID=A0A0E0EW19_9ORYZ
MNIQTMSSMLRYAASLHPLGTMRRPPHIPSSISDYAVPQAKDGMTTVAGEAATTGILELSYIFPALPGPLIIRDKRIIDTPVQKVSDEMLF